MTRDTGLLVLDAVSKSYRRGPERVAALADVDLTVPRATIVALTGRSGSGKTTLCNIAAGWERPDAGRLDRSAPVGRGPLPWTHVASVPQRLGLVDDLTVQENVLLPHRLSHDPPAGLGEQLLDDLRLTALADRLPRDASLGEQQRTAIARALAADPELAILDEPTGQQDEGHVHRVVEVLDAARRRRASLLVATHDQRLLDLPDVVVHLDQGRVVDVEDRRRG